MFRLVILCFALSALKSVLGQTTQVAECQSINGTLPINTHVEGCTETPCLLPQRQDAVIHVVFKAPYLLHGMRTAAHVLPFQIDYPLGPNEVTCNFLTNSYCPVLEGEVVQYTLRMYIQPFFPTGFPVTLEFRVEDINKKAIWCIRVPILVVSPIQ